VLSEIDDTDTTESTQYDRLYSEFCWKNCVGTLTTCLAVRTAFSYNSGGIKWVSNWVGPYIPIVLASLLESCDSSRVNRFVLASNSYGLYPYYVVFGFQMQSWYQIGHQLDSLLHERPHTNLPNKYVVNMNCNITITIKHTKCSPDLTLIKNPIWLWSCTLHWSPLPKYIWIPVLRPIVNPKIRDSGNIRARCNSLINQNLPNWTCQQRRILVSDNDDVQLCSNKTYNWRRHWDAGM
jgi:hypothetical protein